MLFKLFSILLSFSFISTAFAENSWATLQPSYQQIDFIGFSRARYDMILSTEVAGKVEHVFVDIGDITPKNGKVSCLDDTFSKIDIRSTQNEIELNKIDITYYTKQVFRYSELERKKSVSVNQLDDMKRLLSSAKLTTQHKKILKQRQQETLSRHCIKSPKGWVIEDRYVDPGQWLNIGDPVVKVGNYSKLLVPFSLSVEELSALQLKKNNLTVWLAEYKLQVPASIERISPAFDEQSRKIQVDLLLEENLPAHRGGLRVNLQLRIPDPDNIFLINTLAIDKRFEENWVTKKDGQTIRVEVLSHTKDRHTHIKSPELKAGDQLKLIRH